VRYLRATHAAQSIEAMREDMPRWIDRLRKLGVHTIPLTLGSESARHVDLFANQASRELSAKRMAHQIRDTMPQLRPYKG
jgi:hypothetical protein